MKLCNFGKRANDFKCVSYMSVITVSASLMNQVREQVTDAKVHLSVQMLENAPSPGQIQREAQLDPAAAPSTNHNHS